MKKEELFECMIAFMMKEQMSVRELMHQVVLYYFQKNENELLVRQQAIERTAFDLGVGVTTIKRYLQNY